MKYMISLTAVAVALMAGSASALTWTSANAVSASDPNLVGLWHFDDGTGLSAADVSANANPFTLGNANEWKAGSTWGAGSGGYLDNVANATTGATYSSAMNGDFCMASTSKAITVDWSKSVTVSFWMKDTLANQGENIPVYGGYNGWKNQQVSLIYRPGWDTNFGTIRTDGVCAQEPTGHYMAITPTQEATLTNKGWHQVAIVYNAAARQGSWYLDNVQQPAEYQLGLPTPWGFNYPATDTNGNYVWNPTSNTFSTIGQANTHYDTVGGLTSAVTEFWKLAVGQTTGAGIAIDELLIYQGVITDFSNGFGAPVSSPKYKGDFNNDGVVNDADYTVWADYFGKNPLTDHPTYNPGKGAAGGYNDADYTDWADNFGKLTPATPEPASMSLLGLGLLGLLRRRK